MKKIILSLLGVVFAFLFVACEEDRKDLALTTLSVSDEKVTPSYVSAVIQCALKSSATISEAYVQYAANRDFADSKKVEMTLENGLYNAELTDLQDSTLYYIRYEASNCYSTLITEYVSTFQTLVTNSPTITTTPAVDVTCTSATVGGNVTSDGGLSVTERGIVYSTTKNPTTSSNKKTSGTGTGSYSINLTGLAAETTYYVRAYAINNKGTAYGEEVSFKTTVYGVPTVRTSSATNITSTSATVGGNVTNTGGQPVTERGIVYSTTPNPTTSSNKMTSGAGTGSYSINLTGLSEGTTYYVRAYAINSNGTAYGEEVSFKTTISSAKVRFQMMDMYSITAMYLLDAGNNVLAEYYDLLKLSSYFKIPSGNAYPAMRYSDGTLYYMLDNPYYYYFESGCKYTIQLTDDGTYFVCNVIKDGTYNLPAKVVATYKVHKNELRMQKKVKTE